MRTVTVWLIPTKLEADLGRRSEAVTVSVPKHWTDKAAINWVRKNVWGNQ